MSKKSKRGVSLNNQVISLIGSQLGCGACVDCLNAAFNEAADAAMNKSTIEFLGRFDHLCAVAKAMGEKSGTEEALMALAFAFARYTGADIEVCLKAAAPILGLEIDVMSYTVTLPMSDENSVDADEASTETPEAVEAA